MVDKQRLRVFVLGGAVGALAGILFAPKSGKEFRGSIAFRAGEARERGRETYFEAQERMQERIAEARERSFSPRETLIEGATEEPLPRFEPAAPEPLLDPEPPGELAAVTPLDPPLLRDVAREVPRPAGEDPDPEEIRRRIRETRSRLGRARLYTPEPEDAPEGRDG